MTVIDFRARPNTPEYMAMYPEDYDVFSRMPNHVYPGTNTLAEFVSRLDDHGIDISVFTGRQFVKDGEIVRGISNDYIAECVKAFPDRIVGFAGIDFTVDTKDALAEMERAVRELGLSGFSMDPSYAGDELPHDPRMYPLYAKAQELGVPVVLTMGPNIGYVGKSHDPYPIDKIATDFPDLTIVCSHAAWPRPTEFVNLAYRRPNVYIENSIYQYYPGAEPFVSASDSLIQDQVVYASAFPFNPLDTIERFRALGLSEESIEKITHTNPARVLGLE